MSCKCQYLNICVTLTLLNSVYKLDNQVIVRLPVRRCNSFDFIFSFILQDVCDCVSERREQTLDCRELCCQCDKTRTQQVSGLVVLSNVVPP